MCTRFYTSYQHSTSYAFLVNEDNINLPLFHFESLQCVRFVSRLILFMFYLYRNKTKICLRVFFLSTSFQAKENKKVSYNRTMSSEQKYNPVTFLIFIYIKSGCCSMHLNFQYANGNVHK